MIPQHLPYYMRLLRQIPHGLLRRVARRRWNGWPTMVPLVKGKNGLEIGGPSRVFCGNHLIPIYSLCRTIDACNFSIENIWTRASEDQKFAGRLGKKFNAEACDLAGVGDEAYDFVASSHVLEHTANPMRALKEWKRVLRQGGALLVVVPDKRVTFDRRREFTSLEHIVKDFEANTSEADLTHLEEVLALHDLSLDPGAGQTSAFRERCLQNFSIRAMHHHVFSPEVLVKMFTRLEMQVLNIAVERPFHIIGLAQRVSRSY